MITSTSNPLIKRVRKLKSRKGRRAEGSYFAEGVRVFISAVEAEAPVETIIYCPELLTSQAALDNISTQQAAGVRCVETSAKVFKSISSRDHPFGIGAILSDSMVKLSDLVVEPHSVYVSILDAAEPGNVGTIIRTIDASGASGLILIGQGTDPYHPSSVKASMGALFNLPVCQVEKPERLLDWSKEEGLEIIATSAHAEQPYDQVVYHLPAVILLGSEREGLPAKLLAKADLAVSIPMRGTASSLNLAVAAGLILYEVSKHA